MLSLSCMDGSQQLHGQGKASVLLPAQAAALVELMDVISEAVVLLYPADLLRWPLGTAGHLHPEPSTG